jgi:acetyl esterase/lipase
LPGDLLILDPWFNALKKILLLALVTTLCGCGSVREKVFQMMLEPSPPSVPEGVVVIRDLQFVDTPQGPLFLDVYLPEAHAGEPLPVIIFYFGGGWEMGNRHQLGMYDLEEFPLHGYAVIAADYRLSSTAIFPAQIQDAKAAVRWVRDNSDQYPFDADRIGVIGPSAGGHLAALVGTTGDEHEFESDTASGDQSRTSSAVQAVVDFFGPTDFLQANAHRLDDDQDWEAPDSSVSELLGGPIRQHPDRVAQANPITYISGDEPPFLIIHGQIDEIVPLHQSEILYQALVSHGVESELLVIEDGNHGWGGDFFSSLPIDRSRAFFDEHLKRK